FHRTIAQAAQNRYLLEMIDGLDLSMALLGPSTLGLEARKDEALAEHVALVDALTTRDAAAAEDRAAAHIRNAYAARLTIVIEDGLVG
ncbi:MAG: FCD domain-containing protein, partial [Pseudomonadota bacterium]